MKGESAASRLSHLKANMPYFENSVIFVNLKKRLRGEKQGKKRVCTHHNPSAIQGDPKKVVTLQPQGLDYTREPKVQGPQQGHR